MGRRPMIESISAITLATHDMPRAVRFYRMLGFEVIFGGDEAAFTSFRAGRSYLNLIAACRANVVLVGTRHLLPFRRRFASCERGRGRLSPGHGAARRRMGLVSTERPHRNLTVPRIKSVLRARDTS